MRRRLLVGLGVAVGGLVLVVVVLSVVALKPYRAPSESMIPTIGVGDRFVVNTLADPGVGDVAVFHPPVGALGEGAKCGREVTESQLCARPGGRESEVSFVKRIVAGSGDRVRIRAGRVIRNGRPLDEPYARDCPGSIGCDFSGEITIPDEHFYVLGDNRGASDDSRFWGPVHEDWISGKVLGKYWPPGEIGRI